MANDLHASSLDHDKATIHKSVNKTSALVDTATVTTLSAHSSQLNQVLAESVVEIMAIPAGDLDVVPKGNSLLDATSITG